jgi:FkbM family methyltransferase
MAVARSGQCGHRRDKAGHMIQNLIFDVGMNIGEDTAFYLKKGFRVVAIEANPVLVKAARKRFFFSILSGRLTLLNVGIGMEEGDFPFYINKTHQEWSSLIREIGARGDLYEEVRVYVVTLDTLLRKYGVPYYLKIDIEGMDNVAVEAMGKLGDRPRYVSVETGPGPEWLDNLHRLSYRWFKLLDQTKVDQIVPPCPAVEGKTIKYRFRVGSSGPFGEETPGGWKSYAEVRKEWINYLALPQVDKNLWYDIHAKLD